MIANRLATDRKDLKSAAALGKHMGVRQSLTY